MLRIFLYSNCDALLNEFIKSEVQLTGSKINCKFCEHLYVMLMACGNDHLRPLYDAHGNEKQTRKNTVAVKLLIKKRLNI